MTDVPPAGTPHEQAKGKKGEGGIADMISTCVLEAQLGSDENNPPSNPPSKMQANAAVAKLRIAQVESEIQKLQVQINALNARGRPALRTRRLQPGFAASQYSPGTSPYASPYADDSPYKEVRRGTPQGVRQHKPANKLAIAKKVGKQTKVNLTECYDRLPKPMAGKIDLWATRTLGKSAIRTPSSHHAPHSSIDALIVEQPFQVHHTGSLYHVQCLQVHDGQVTFFQRAIGMCSAVSSQPTEAQEARLHGQMMIRQAGFVDSCINQSTATMPIPVTDVPGAIEQTMYNAHPPPPAPGVYTTPPRRKPPATPVNVITADV